MRGPPDVISSAKPRGGRRFEPTHELELDEDAIHAAAALPGAHRGLVVLREMAGPFGVPDFVAVVGSRGNLDDRLALDVRPLLNQVDAGVVAAAAPRAGRTPEALAVRLGWPLESVRRRIPHLVRGGALLQDEAGRYTRPAALQPIGRLYAIEAKVRDWRRALKQARTYSVWTDSYVLVIASLGPAAIMTALEATDTDGAGLVVEGRWLRRPRLGSRTDAQRLWGSEHVIAALRSPAIPQ
jgi:hypothetical protein